MGTDFIPKRPHKKSRGGCQTCKTRKVKCDEAQPKCTFCDRRKLDCAYPSRQVRSQLITPPSSDVSADPSRDVSPIDDGEVTDITVTNQLVISPWCPPPNLTTSSGTMTLADLRLLHHWSTVTCNNISIGDGAYRTLQSAVPQLAFENDFLLNGILGVASLDVERFNPDSTSIQKQINIYRGKAVARFRQLLPRIQPGTGSYEAALIMSILLVVLYSPNASVDEADLIIVKWLIFYRGLSAVIRMTSFPKVVLGGSVGPFFRREFTELTIEPVVPKLLVNMLQEVDIMDNDFRVLEDYCAVLDALGALYASLKQDGLGPALYIRIVTWCSRVGQEFTDCARERRPRAIVIMAHYLVFLKLVEGLWWLEHIPDRDIGKIVEMLGPRWLPYLEAPLLASTMTNKDEIAALLLR